MKAGDFLICTFEGDTATPPNTYVAEIVSVDVPNEYFSCRMVDTGTQYTFQYSSNSSGPWHGQDAAGTDYSIETHNIYTGAAMAPTRQDVALVTFADGSKDLCSVENVSSTVDVVFYHQPYPRLSLDLVSIVKSDWDAHPAGEHIESIEACRSSDDISFATDTYAFDGGWWTGATRQEAHAGRIGGVIAPFATVVHTTDMVPGSWAGLVSRWTTEKGLGDCAHFLIGRDESAGVIQLASIFNNANHAEGPGHGSFIAGQQTWRPNSVSVGIEVHCAGSVKQVNGAWRLVENGAPQGAALPGEDVVPDPHRPGRGWHKVTEYQYEKVGEILDSLEAVLTPLPKGCVARSIEAPPSYGVFPTGRRVGHVSLHAAQRGDPWPPTCEWLRSK
jgi:N-acetylmuramoyl-L-alanine amidase.